MFVPLIPFFLVARLAIHDDTWNNGPEFVFDVEINSTSIPINYDDTNKSNYTMARLYCRPKGSDTLKCYLDDVEKRVIDLTNNNTIEVPEDESNIPEDSFEIKFNTRGIDYLIVNEDICDGYLNSIKSIAELLAIGTDLSGIPDGIFYAVENSTLGECNVTYEIDHLPFKGLTRGMKSQRYELESLPQLNKVAGEAIVIRKTRNLSNCSCQALYYYGSYCEDGMIDDDDSQLESSTSRIYISDTQFASSLTATGTMSLDETKRFTVTDTINLALNHIRPGQRKLSKISKMGKTSIAINSDIERIYVTK